jgi:uncharacterized damage-inducible protein DinB
MNAEKARAVAETVGLQLQNEWMVTYKVIAAIPEEKRDYKPEPNSRSAWELATHLATADIWFLDGVLAGEFQQPNETLPADTVAGVAEWYKREFPNRLERVLAMDGNKLAQIVNFFGMKMPAVSYMLFTLVHMVHHRGQISSYLRPMGSKVPSIYGGSFDEQWQGPADANA